MYNRESFQSHPRLTSSLASSQTQHNQHGLLPGTFSSFNSCYFGTAYWYYLQAVSDLKVGGLAGVTGTVGGLCDSLKQDLDSELELDAMYEYWNRFERNARIWAAVSLVSCIRSIVASSWQLRFDI